MRVQFSRWGNSLALRIPAAYARDLNVSEGSEAELEVEHGRLVATPAVDLPVYDLNTLLDGVTEDNLHAEVSTGSAMGGEFH
jgi:antitoxin MazE